MPDRMSEWELMGALWGLWILGFESTAASTSNTVLQMLQHPDHARMLADGPHQASTFINECLRRDPAVPVAGAARVTDCEVEIGGTTIPPDTNVMFLVGAVNRDPDAFPDPDQLVPGRNTSAMMTFGHGLHYCIGAGLSQAVTSTVLRRLYTALPGLSQAGRLARPPIAGLRTFDDFPVGLGNARA